MLILRRHISFSRRASKVDFQFASTFIFQKVPLPATKSSSLLSPILHKNKSSFGSHAYCNMAAQATTHEASSHLGAQEVQSSAPVESDTTNAIDLEKYTEIKEGKASILVPKDTVSNTSSKSGSKPQSVFYNPIQQFNRDLSILATKTYGESFLVQKRADWDKKQAKQNGAGRKSGSRKRKRAEADSATKNQDGDAKETAMEQTEAKPENIIKSNCATTEVDQTTSEKAVNGDGQPHIPHWPFTILDALSATGLRALRYAHEVPFATRVVANDLVDEAAQSIDRNIQHNSLSKKVRSNKDNAICHMYNLIHKSGFIAKYEVIDLDPFGTAAPFLDAAVQAVVDDGILCITCTDAGVYASMGYSEKAFALYGGLPLKGPHCHEAGLRLIIHAIATAAARYGRAIEPLLSLSVDFYARVFVRVRKSPADVKFLSSRTMLVYNCGEGCGSWSIQPLGKAKQTSEHNHKFSIAQGENSKLCEHCGFKVHVAGPMYAGPLHSIPFVQALLSTVEASDEEIYQTKKRMVGMLNNVLDEAKISVPRETAILPPNSASTTTSQNPKPEEETAVVADAKPSSTPPPSLIIPHASPNAIDKHPFFFNPHYTSKILHCQTPPEALLRGALRHMGYRATRSHTKPASIKTDAPWSVIWGIMRSWIAQRAPIKEGAVRKGTAGWKILNPDAETQENVSATAVDESSAEKGPGPVVFDEKLEQLGVEEDARKLVRYQMNPRPNWGPMSKGGGK